MKERAFLRGALRKEVKREGSSRALKRKIKAQGTPLRYYKPTLHNKIMLIMGWIKEMR